MEVFTKEELVQEKNKVDSQKEARIKAETNMENLIKEMKTTYSIPDGKALQAKITSEEASEEKQKKEYEGKCEAYREEFDV
jgi:hypothetical protein